MLHDLISQKIHILIHDLLHSLDILRMSYSALKDNVPMEISESMSIVGRISDQFIEEVIDLREHVQQRVDLSSPVEAAAQIRRLASDWRGYEATLSDAIHKIQVSGTKTGDESLDRIAVETLPVGLAKLERMMGLLKDTEPEFLTAPLYDGTDRLRKRG